MLICPRQRVSQVAVHTTCIHHLKLRDIMIWSWGRPQNRICQLLYFAIVINSQKIPKGDNGFFFLKSHLHHCYPKFMLNNMLYARKKRVDPQWVIRKGSQHMPSSKTINGGVGGISDRVGETRLTRYSNYWDWMGSIISSISSVQMTPEAPAKTWLTINTVRCWTLYLVTGAFT